MGRSIITIEKKAKYTTFRYVQLCNKTILLLRNPSVMQIVKW